MNLQSPSTIAAAWLLVPLFVVIASLGLGAGLRLVSGLELGVMTAPAGFLAGMAIMTELLAIGVSGKLTVVLVLVLAALGPLSVLATARTWQRWRPSSTLLWAAGAAVTAYAIALAPLAGSGHLGILGYVFNDDSSIHISLVQALYHGGAHALNLTGDSFQRTTYAFNAGYPLGSYTWPLVARTATGIDPFYVWSPFTALAVAMLALACFEILRPLRAPPVLTALACALIANGHLVYAYLTQGGLKEVLLSACIYSTAALVQQAFQERIRVRAFIPAAFAAGATVADLGTAGLAWVGPILVVTGAVLAVRALRRRSHSELRSLALFAALAAVVALPVIVTSSRFFKNAQASIADPHQVGNLLAPISVFQSLNVWLAQDYRFPIPDATTVSYIGMVVAGVLAMIGLAFALYRWDIGLILAIVAGVAGVALITPRTSIYYDAKTYGALAPALGLLTAAGVLTLIRLTRFTALGAVLGIAIGAAVIASDLYTYWGVWITPKQRFQEMAAIANRLAGKGSILLNEREEYGPYFFRRTHPWNDWVYAQHYDYRHIKFPYALAPPPPRTPDFDDYPLSHVESHDWLLERKSPDSSLPPLNYTHVEETSFYRLWRRTGPAPRDHVPFGSDGLRGAAPVKCTRGKPRSQALTGIAAEAVRDHTELAVALPGPPSRRIVKGTNWVALTPTKVGAASGQSAGRDGIASTPTRVPAGLYTAWLQGSYGPGARLYVKNGAGSGTVGEIHGDLGAADGWFRLGTFRVGGGRSTFTLIGLGPPWWHAGSHHFNLNGDLLIESAGARGRIVRIDPRRIGGLCGQRVDWVEVPPA